MNELHLFAGGGGGIYGGQILGHTTIGAVELELDARKALLARQRDGWMPRFPIWDDVCTFDPTPYIGRTEVLCGGFPCQDISSIGLGKGISGRRSGLWKQYLRIAKALEPKFIFAENSPNLRTRGLDVVLEDLAAMGYDARWCVLGGGHVGAPHLRERMWVLAYPARERLGRWIGLGEEVLASKLVGGPWRRESPVDAASRFFGMVDGMTDRRVRLRAAGNGQIPLVAALAWTVLTRGL